YFTNNIFHLTNLHINYSFNHYNIFFEENNYNFVESFSSKRLILHYELHNNTPEFSNLFAPLIPFYENGPVYDGDN
ncbi:TPA: hypothetical protein ACGO3V_001642, partial [Streptococcus suis]